MKSDGADMNVKEKIEKQVAKKREEVAQLESQMAELQAKITELNGIITGFEEAIQLFPKELTRSDFDKDVASIRKGSDVEKAFLLIRGKGEAMRIEDIVAAIGKENTKKTRQALGGQLSYNYREGRIFTRPAPNTFGLLVWSGQNHPELESAELDQEPNSVDLPDGFGMDV